MEYNTLATQKEVQTVVEALTKKNIDTFVVENAALALAKVKELIPQGASVMNGSSRTLEQIGFVDYLKAGQHGWNNLHEAVLAEKDPARQAQLRKQAVLSDFYLGSVHAITQTGEFVVASNTGSQLPHIVFTSPNLILVVSTKKIVSTLADAMKRLEDHVIPLEEKHMQELYGFGTVPNKILIFKGENPRLGRSVKVIFVNEDIGF